MDAAHVKNPVRSIVFSSHKENLKRMSQERRPKSFLKITFQDVSSVVFRYFRSPW